MSSTGDCIITAVSPIRALPCRPSGGEGRRERVNIYLACTVRAIAADSSPFARSRTMLERHGHTVMTHHLLSDDVDTAESALERA